jgi:hypothetical protein
MLSVTSQQLQQSSKERQDTIIFVWRATFSDVSGAISFFRLYDDDDDDDDDDNNNNNNNTLGRDSIVGIETRYGPDGPGIKYRSGLDFPHLIKPLCNGYLVSFPEVERFGSWI